MNLLEIPPAVLGTLPLFESMEILSPKLEKVEKVVDGLPDGASTIPVAVVGTNENDNITRARRNDSQPLHCKLQSHLDWWIQLDMSSEIPARWFRTSVPHIAVWHVGGLHRFVQGYKLCVAQSQLEGLE